MPEIFLFSQKITYEAVQKLQLRNLLAKRVFTSIVTGCLFFLSQCQKNHEASATVPVFDLLPTRQELKPLVNEISGIADSKMNPGYLWGQEDSGNPPQLYLISHQGIVSKKVHLAGISNRDWEDIALVNGNIYIAETGDNALVYNNYKFYKFPEPSAAIDTVTNIETINFTYPDGSHDAEAFLVDASSLDIYIITKSDNPSKIYRLSYPYNATNNVTARVGTLPFNEVVSAASSTDEIMIKTYTNLFYYKRVKDESIDISVQKAYSTIPYLLEPQGEAVGFAINNSGFYTLSEKGLALTVGIHFYKRN
jgi:hypothetical protein